MQHLVLTAGWLTFKICAAPFVVPHELMHGACFRLFALERPRYGWKLFTWDWTGATPGDHTLVSRVTDTTGAVQPTTADLASKKTFLEDNGQFPRKITIA